MSEEIESGAAQSGDPVAISLALGGASRAFVAFAYSLNMLIRRR